MSNNLPNNLHCSYHAEFIEEAEDLFIEAKDQLFDVNKWAQFCGFDNINFILLETHQKEVYRKARSGDYIRVIKPGTSILLHIHNIEYDDYPDDNKESFLICIEKAGTDINIINLMIERNNMTIYSYCYFNNDNAYLDILSSEEWTVLLQNYINFH